MILVDRLKIHQLIEKFHNAVNITRKELKEFYDMYNPELKETTFRWMLYELKKMKIITAKDRGLYSVAFNNQTFINTNETLIKKEYQPVISMKLQQLYDILRNQFPYLTICIWETSWINEFMVHQPGKFLTIVEVENGTEETIFNNLKANYNNLFIKPNRQELEWYVYNNNSSIVVKKLVSQAPLLHNKNLIIPKLEKILIDLLAEKDFYYPYQGQELENIYKNAFNDYKISLKSLNRYAERRKCGDKLKNYRQKLQLDKAEGSVF